MDLNLIKEIGMNATILLTIVTVGIWLVKGIFKLLENFIKSTQDIF